MRILVLNADYPRFLAWLYRSQPELVSGSYVRQMATRNASLFGVADFYSRNFMALGHEAAEIHVNNPYLQAAWAREHGMATEPAPEVTGSQPALPDWLQRTIRPFKPLLRPLARKVGLSPRLDAQLERILLAQIEDFRPDLVLNQDVFHVDTRLMRKIGSIGRPILIGQVGIEPSVGEDWTVYDLMLSQLPATVNAFRSRGIRAEISHLAFESTIFDQLQAHSVPDLEVSFVGTVSNDHRQRIALLEAAAQRYDLKVWGNLPNSLPATSPLRRCFQGEVWGAHMYGVLQRSKISLNSHIDLAGREAGNMRLFEATGIGAFLLTDFKDNLHTLFEPDHEVAVWRSIDECLKAIETYLRNDDRRAEIARAGRARTIAQHTYRHRTAEILGFVESLRTPR